MATQVASLFGVLSLDSSQFEKGLDKADQGMSNLGGRVQSLGGDVMALGANMTAFTAPLAAGLGAGIQQSQQFSRQMSNVNSILGISGDEAAALREEVLALGGDSVAGPQAVASAYYDIVSGVQDASSHMDIMNAAIATSEAGQADLKATTSALVATMNSYSLAADDAGYVSDVFTRTVQTGVLTMDELASAFPQVSGLASSLGIEVGNLAGQMSYLTTQGFSASESATFLKSMMTTLLNPTTDMQAAIQGLGYETGSALIEAEGLTGAYQLLAQQNGGLEGLVTNQEALQGSLALTKEGADAFLSSFTTGIDGATEAARGINNETATWALFTSKLQETAIIAGDQLAPTLIDLLDNHIMPLIDGVVQFSDKHPELFQNIVMVMGGLALLGPVLVGIGSAMTVVGGIISTATALVGGLTGAAGVLSAALTFLTGPIGLVVAGIGGLIYWMTQQDGGVIGVLNRASIAATQLSGIFRMLLGGAVDWVAGKFEGLLGWLNDALDKMREFLGLQSDIGTLAINDESAGGDTGSAGFRAKGGPVSAGSPYIVGEEGPELFVPRSSGQIMSNRDTMAMANGGGGGQTIQVTISNITANSYEGGQAAGRGFSDALMERLQGNGLNLSEVGS